MISTPEDRALMRTFVAVMDDTTTVTIADGAPTELVPATPDECWEFAALLVAVARRAGWAPQKPLTT